MLLSGVLRVTMQTVRSIFAIGLRKVADLLDGGNISVTDVTEEDHLLRKRARKETPRKPPQRREEEAPTSKPRDRTKYDPKQHRTFQVAAIGILKHMLSNPGASFKVRDLEDHVECSQSSIRTACKELVTLGVLSGEGFPTEYRIVSVESAAGKLAEFEASN